MPWKTYTREEYQEHLRQREERGRRLTRDLARMMREKIRKYRSSAGEETPSRDSE